MASTSSAVHPADPASRSRGPTRFLFVGGLIWRKGPDLLLEAWQRAFPDRDDVVLVVKDFGADGVYRGDDREPIRDARAQRRAAAHRAAAGRPLRRGLADLYRSRDVLVHPYRGEGFAMPVLEAMASGLPVIVTAGGPTRRVLPARRPAGGSGPGGFRSRLSC